MGGRYRLDADSALRDPIQQQIETVSVPRFHQQALPVGQNLGFHDIFLLEYLRCEVAGLAAADKDLHGVFVNFFAHAVNLPLRHHVAVAGQDNLV